MRAVMMLFLVAGCSAPPQAPPKWHVSGNALRAPDGRAAIFRGVNLGSQKNMPYLGWATEDDYRRVRTDFGMNAIRFVMTWSAVEPTEGSYDEQYLDGVAERMKWASDANLSVVLDMHEDIYGEGFGYDGAPRWTCDAAHYMAFKPAASWYLNALDPNVEACVDRFFTDGDLRGRFVAMWAHVAARLASEPAVVGFDPLNEPEWGSYPLGQFEQDRLQPFYEQVVGAVRGAAPDWVAFLEPGASRNVGVSTGLVPFSFADVVYAPHAYDSQAEGGSGFDPSHRGMVLGNGASLAAEATSLNAALWIGEYGGQAAAPGIVDYMTAEYDAAGAAAAGSMYWSYDKGGGYSMLDSDGKEVPLLVDTLVRPYPARTAGDPISYAWDASTSTFTFVYTPDPAAAAATEIIVPARRYPNGFTIDCGGCVSSTDGDILSITKPGSSTIVLRSK
jgi:endoglycosylceramidase